MNSNGHGSKRPGERAAEHSESFFDRMMEKGEYAEEEIKKYAKTADHYIQKHPVRSTIIAGVVGLLLGKLIK